MVFLKIDEKMIIENCYGFNESEWVDWKKEKVKWVMINVLRVIYYILFWFVICMILIDLWLWF